MRSLRLNDTENVFLLLIYFYPRLFGLYLVCVSTALPLDDI